MAKPFYVTTPIYYVNDVPHIGHAYTTIAADVLARYQRSNGREVYFLTGTDEHGQKIDKAARQQNIKPIQLADRVVERFRALWQRFNIRYDDFIRTTEPRHEQVVQRLFAWVKQRDDIYLGEYEGWYCTGCEEYFTEGQFENQQCPVHKKPLDRMKEKSYFFRMSKYQQALLDHIAAHPDFIQPEMRRNEIVHFVKEGLRDLSISRTSFHWGVPVPQDPEHVIYVWIDALANYISALGWDGSESGDSLYHRIWPADVHLMGKDILRFHAVYWPTFLLSAGLPLPKRVFAHGWWTVGGEKMSKSLRNVVEPHALIDAYGADAVRYFLLREVPFGLDGDFSHEALIGRINADLANDLGNLLRRTVTIAEKYTEGKVPAMAATSALDQALREKAQQVTRESAEHLEQCAFHKALVSIWELVRAANRFVDEAGPWTLHKEGKTAELATVVHSALESLRYIGVLLAPFMPETGRTILEQLGVSAEESDLRRERLNSWGQALTGRTLKKGPPLFPRIEPDRAQSLIAQFNTSAKPEPKKDEAAGGAIGIEDLKKVDLRVGVVRTAERVQKSDKLLKLQVDLGEGQPRQIVAGIGKAYTPEQLVGKRVLVVANLKPVTLMGVESRGMLMAAGPGGSEVVLAEFCKELPAGESVH